MNRELDKQAPILIPVINLTVIYYLKMNSTPIQETASEQRTPGSNQSPPTGRARDYYTENYSIKRSLGALITALALPIHALGGSIAKQGGYKGEANFKDE